MLCQPIGSVPDTDLSGDSGNFHLFPGEFPGGTAECQQGTDFCQW